MPHELEFVNGQASYVGRKPGWHHLGTVIKDLSYEEAMKTAHLGNWNVRAESFQAVIENDILPAEDHRVIVRDNPETGLSEILGVVGGKYSTIQNEQAFAVASFLEDLGATIETAGSIRKGRQVFMTLDLDGGFVIDPDGANDRVQGYLVLRSSHDGSMGVEAGVSYIRVVCANTFDQVIGNQQTAYKVRHTTNGDKNLANAQSALLMANEYGRNLGELAKALYEVPMNNKEFLEVAQIMYPKPEDDAGKRAKTMHVNTIDLLGDLFNGGRDVRTTDNIRNTAWAGLNAMTERLDWFRTTRGDSNNLYLGSIGYNQPVTIEKSKITRLVTQWAKEKKPEVFDKVLV